MPQTRARWLPRVVNAVGVSTLALVSLLPAASSAAAVDLSAELSSGFVTNGNIDVSNAKDFDEPVADPSTLGVGARLRLTVEPGITVAARVRTGTSGLMESRTDTLVGFGAGFLFARPDYEIELSAEIGRHTIGGLAPDLLVTAHSDPTLEMPYVAASVAANKRVSRHVLIGMVATLGTDLQRQSAHLTWTPFSGHASADVTVGGFFSGLAFHVVFDLTKPHR